MKRTVNLSSGIVVEQLAGEVLVVSPGNDVLRLSGAPADVVLDLQAGKQVDSSHPSVSDLVQLGIVTVSGLSRRSLVKTGVFGAGAGIAVLSLPTVAAASTEPGNGGALCLDGVPRIGLYEIDGDKSLFLLVSEDLQPENIPGGTELSIVVGDRKVTSTDFREISFETEWTFTGIADELEALEEADICGNITVGGTIYRIIFRFRD